MGGSGLGGASVIVTGAAGGVSREVVRLLRDAGASVVAEDVAPAVEALADGDDGIATLVADVRTSEAASGAIRLAQERFGKVDVLSTTPLCTLDAVAGDHGGRVGRPHGDQRQEHVPALSRSASADVQAGLGPPS